MRISFFALMFLIACGDSSKAPSQADAIPACTATIAGQTDGNGHLCTASGSWQAILDGQCGATTPSGNSDCPAGYTCTDGNCVASLGTSRIWFGTDPLQPGATLNCNGSGCNPAYDYIYNIMAKGYKSLDEWCLYQAQQSLKPTVRGVAKWKALVVAQPDSGVNSPSNTGNPSTNTSLSPEGLTRVNAFMASAVANYLGPNQPFSATNTLEDRHGYIRPNKNIFWSGIGGSTEAASCNSGGCVCQDPYKLPSTCQSQSYNIYSGEVPGSQPPEPYTEAFCEDPTTPVFGNVNYISNSISFNAWSNPGVDGAGISGSIAYFGCNNLPGTCLASSAICFFNENDVLFSSDATHPYTSTSVGYEIGPFGGGIAGSPQVTIPTDPSQSYGIVCLSD
ncbi:MAG: hypothetical protein V4534_05785 [Myxococcota bacterium]